MPLCATPHPRSFAWCAVQVNKQAVQLILHGMGLRREAEPEVVPLCIGQRLCSCVGNGTCCCAVAGSHCCGGVEQRRDELHERLAACPVLVALTTPGCFGIGPPEAMGSDVQRGKQPFSCSLSVECGGLKQRAPRRCRRVVGTSCCRDAGSVVTPLVRLICSCAWGVIHSPMSLEHDGSNPE